MTSALNAQMHVRLSCTWAARDALHPIQNTRLHRGLQAHLSTAGGTEHSRETAALRTAGATSRSRSSSTGFVSGASGSAWVAWAWGAGNACMGAGGPQCRQNEQSSWRPHVQPWRAHDASLQFAGN